MNEKIPKSPNLRVYPSDLLKLRKLRVGEEKQADTLKRILKKNDKKMIHNYRNRRLVKDTLKNHGIILSKEYLDQLDYLPIDKLSKKVEKIINKKREKNE